WERIVTGVEVKLCPAPQEARETFVLCRSPLRKEKEKAMRARQVTALEQALTQLQARATAGKRTLRDLGKAERRVGRLFCQYSRAAQLFDVKIEQIADAQAPGKKRVHIEVRRKEDLAEWAALADGC